MSDVSKTNDLIEEALGEARQEIWNNRSQSQGKLGSYPDSHYGGMVHAYRIVTSVHRRAEDARVPVQPDDRVYLRHPDGSPKSNDEIRAEAAAILGRVPVQGEPNDDREALATVMFEAYADDTAKPFAEEDYGIRKLYLAQADAVITAGFSRTTVPDAATAAIAAVRAIHYDAGMSQGYGAQFKGGYGEIENCCAACGSFGEFGVAYPCPTIAALDGAPEPEVRT